MGKRYIDANLLKAEFTGNFAKAYAVPLIKSIIDQQPAADVQEAKQGQWELIKKDRSKCSECGFQRNIETQFGWKFCPMCGADMGIYKDNEQIY